MTAVTATLDEEAARALTLGEAKAHANGHHAMVGAEYILYGIFARFEEEPTIRGSWWALDPFHFIKAEMVMSRIVLIKHHSEPKDDLVRCDCYEVVLARAFERARGTDSSIGLHDLMHAIIQDPDSLAFSILNHFMDGTMK